MKNKKLVATVASLCLVVVAVVAAVVGVFAATTQRLGASVTVNYTAVNVSARVDLKTYGLKDRSGTHSFSSDTYNEKIFNPTADSNASGAVNGAPNATDSIAVYEYGWEAEGQTGGFIGFSVYEFKFTNYNQSKALNLSWTVAGTNLTKFCYTSPEALTIAKGNFTGTWAEVSGELSASASNFTAQTSGTTPASPTTVEPSSGTYSTTVAVNSGIIYVYVVLALSNANTTTSTAQIDFTLTSANA